MRLVVFHYHDHPGGVRQVIQRGLQHFLRQEIRIYSVVLVLGMRSDPSWQREVEELLRGIALEWLVHPDFAYQTTGGAAISPEAEAAFRKVLRGGETVVWAHNLCLGRNLALLENLPVWCGTAGASLILHHHDWWWDGRWERWRDWEQRGVRLLEEALEKSIPCGAHIRHWCVNRADLDWVGLRAGRSVQWTGVPPAVEKPLEAAEQEAAGEWLKQRSGGRPVWLAPVRALRRKNLAEALFLVRSLQPEAVLLTTGGPGSGTEAEHWKALCRTAEDQNWPLIPSALEKNMPVLLPSRRQAGLHLDVRALMAASNAIVLPSLQEGFGLPVLEAAQWRVPVLWRSNPEGCSNLQGMGCRPMAVYETLPVAAASFDKAGENRRRETRWNHMRKWLPVELRGKGRAETAGTGQTIDFGKLTLEAQMEVLASGALPEIDVPWPAVPEWTPEGRQVPWDSLKLCQESPMNGECPGTGGSLLPEVLRRFEWWREHPLLWPSPGGQT